MTLFCRILKNEMAKPYARSKKPVVKKAHFIRDKLFIATVNLRLAVRAPVSDFHFLLNLTISQSEVGVRAIATKIFLTRNTKIQEN